MALEIPDNFDVHSEELDANETFIRDSQKLAIDNWARFRHTIHIGNEASNLHSTSPIPDEVKEAHRELAKSHYEAITSLGCAALSLEMIAQFPEAHPLVFKKLVKDFYFHAGCLLDNLARLIFIICDPNSASAKNRRGLLLRHWVDWGSLDDYAGYKRLKCSRRLKQIINIRNNLTHSWSCPIVFHPSTPNLPYWPIAVRSARDHPWPYDELDIIRQRYRRWHPLPPMLKSDLDYIEGLQNQVFGKLVRDVRRFE